MTNNKYFDIKRDNLIIKAGGFFCSACLVGRPASEQSADNRYCQNCYEFLLAETKLLENKRSPSWLPKTTTNKLKEKKSHPSPTLEPALSRPAQALQGKTRCNIIPPIVIDTPAIMATLESPKITVALFQPSVSSKASNKRGPKHKALPVDVIRQLASQGNGSKKIAATLKTQGVKVGFRTIARMLSGERGNYVEEV